MNPCDITIRMCWKKNAENTNVREKCESKHLQYIQRLALKKDKKN